MHKGDGVSTILGDADSGGGESLNGRKNMVRREVKRRALGTMSYQTSYKRSPPLWLLIGQKNTARTAVTVWNWSGKTLSPGALLAVLYFSSCHIFPPV